MKYFTQEEIDFIKSNHKKMTVRKMDKILGRDYRSIWTKLKRLGIIGNVHRKKAIRYKKVPSPYPELKSDCWICISHAKESNGYPMIHRNGKHYSLHRYAYERYYKKEIPEGMCICHKCDTPACINPDHLFLGTVQDNVRDMIKKGRDNYREGSKRLLTDKQALEIFKSNEPGRVLVNKYNVNIAVISNIRRRRNYREVTTNI